MVGSTINRIVLRFGFIVSRRPSRAINLVLSAPDVPRQESGRDRLENG